MELAKGIVENLKALRAANGERVPSPSDLAVAFGWSEGRVREREITWKNDTFRIGRAYLGVQAAAVFASTEEVQPQVDGAALYGYHAAVRWGVFADATGIVAFNSHWVQHNAWFTVPLVRWNDLDSHSALLGSFSPHEIGLGTADRGALAGGPQPQLLQPVDDELVERLDAWRDEALKASRSASGVDEQLQVLFAKLFVLRTIEDRALAPEVQPLSKAISSHGLDSEALWVTLTQAKKHIGSELFDELELDLIPPFVISGVIGDLYKPRRLPIQDSRYNFSWIDADVLGLAYEKYLSTLLHPRPPSPQQDLFQQNSRGVERVSVRKAGGVYYTPQYLTRYLSESTIHDYLIENGPESIPTVVDFACGSGSFLVAAVDVLLQNLKKIDPHRNWGRKIIEGGFINGIDIDAKAVTVARLNIWNRLAEEADPLPLPNLSKVIVQGDGLDRATWNHLDRSYDIVLGNPPFLATALVTNRESLEHRYKTAKGRFDYSSLFVEQAINVSAPDGRIGVVVPNRLFRNANGSTIRDLLTEEMDLKTIVDFGSLEVFQGTAAYVGCIIATHREPDKAFARTVDVVEVKEMPEQFVAAALFGDGGDLLESQVNSYEAQHPRGARPWLLLSSAEKASQVRLEDSSVDLSEIAGVFQGIKTGANDLFLFDELASDRSGEAQVINGLGDTHLIESALLRPAIYGSEVKRYDSVVGTKLLLYPYKNGVCISEAELEKDFPMTLHYLESYRELLSSRSSITASGLKWYELVRRRDEQWLNSPKLLIRDLAPETAFAVDELGSVFMVSGTAVTPSTDDLLWPMLAYLNSKPVDRLVRRTTPQFRGSFQKFEPQHLQRIPVLRRLVDDVSFAEQLSLLARTATSCTSTMDFHSASISMAEIDRLVGDAMGQAGVESGT